MKPQGAAYTYHQMNLFVHSEWRHTDAIIRNFLKGERFKCFTGKSLGLIRSKGRLCL